MKPSDREKLTAALREHVGRVADDLRDKMRVPGPVRTRAQKLHVDEQVGEDFDVWTDLLSRRAAVLWVLKSVYVRVLEDRGLLSPGRILDIEAQQLFERLAPNLGETAFLRWVYRDLASDRGGLPELFGAQPAEIAAPADELSRELLAFWRHRDPDSGTHWSFADELFEGELMGDLYQELDPVVKDRFALCQTPDFVRAFMLDRTLTPAIETFGAAEVRLLDPSCGSGHFLIDGLKRLVAAAATEREDWDRETLVAHCLDRVVGIDLNDYACALARARLLMTAAELAGVTSLADPVRFQPRVYWADGLEQVEKGMDLRGQQLDLLDPARDEEPRASLTRPEVRSALRDVLEPRFHAVVANPPYIVESDPARKAYHREKVGRRRRYVSAYRQYSLASPFTERCFQLAVDEGFVGLITSNNFMKREFGKPLIEKVLKGLDLTLVVDSSQAYIPFHGTPTVLIFGRNRGPSSESVRAVMGKRGESGTPDDPAKGRVWTSIEEGWSEVGFENEYVSVAELPGETLAEHPWSLGGGGAAELRELLESGAMNCLAELVDEIGAVSVIRADDVYEPPRGRDRGGLPAATVLPHVVGQDVRDWAITPGSDVVHPYDESGQALESLPAELTRWLSPYRTLLQQRVAFGKSQLERGLCWFEYSMLFSERFLSPLLLAFTNVATHNHFSLIRSRMVVNSKAPVIKLPAEATEDDHLALLGLLNSSVACFWMKQVFHAKAAGGIGRGLEPEPFMERYEFDATKAKLFPVAADATQTIPFSLALDRLARFRVDHNARAIVDRETWSSAPELRAALDHRRAGDLDTFQHMVALQEELDWLCYALYGLDDASDIVDSEDVELLLPTWLPWCLDFAARDQANREAIAHGDEPAELPSVWFERHRWEPVTELPDTLSAPTRARIEARRARTGENAALALIESANFKRRWYRPDYQAEEEQALADWIADRVEAAAKERGKPATIDQLVAALQDDPRVLAAAEVLTGRRDFSLSTLVANAIAADAVPNHPFHVYKPSGLIKRQVWERTWVDQRREDAGEEVTPEVPPSYKSSDFRKTAYWRLRGKLDVPKERFIAFTELPGEVPGRAANGETLYGWAGWTPLQRLRTILAIDEELEDAAIPLADRIALLDSAWRLLPDVAREDPTAANRLKAELQALLGTTGPSPEMLADWRERFPPPGTRRRRRRRSKTGDE